MPLSKNLLDLKSAQSAVIHKYFSLRLSIPNGKIATLDKSVTIATANKHKTIGTKLMRYYTFGNLPNGPGGDGDRWSGVRFWLTTLLIFWTLSTIGLGWLVNSFFILIGLLTFVPIIAFFGLQWWVKRSIITAECPVCDASFTASRATQFQCPNCGEPLQEQQNKFVRITPPGTIDIDVQVVE